MLRDVARSTSWRERLSYVVRGPGWACRHRAEASPGNRHRWLQPSGPRAAAPARAEGLDLGAPAGRSPARDRAEVAWSTTDQAPGAPGPLDLLSSMTRASAPLPVGHPGLHRAPGRVEMQRSQPEGPFKRTGGQAYALGAFVGDDVDRPDSMPCRTTKTRSSDPADWKRHHQGERRAAREGGRVSGTVSMSTPPNTHPTERGRRRPGRSPG